MTEFKNVLAEDNIDKDTGFSLRETNFLDILFDECKGNVREAMTRSGYSKSVPTSSVTKKFKKEIQELSKAYLSIQTAKAAISLVDVIDDPNQVGAGNIIKAAREILDRGGVFKEEDTTKVVEKNIFILPAKDITDNE